MSLRRREFLKAASAAGIVGTAPLPNGCTVPANRATVARVVVVGGGYGGATAAKYLRLWSDGAVKVTLVEANAAFVSCPMSNLVLGGSKSIADLTVSYD